MSKKTTSRNKEGSGANKRNRSGGTKNKRVSKSLKQALRLRRVSMPASFECQSGQLVFGQLYSLLPSEKSQWTSSAMRGTYFVENVLVQGRRVANLVWHESVEEPQQLLRMTNLEFFDPNEEDCIEPLFKCCAVGRGWFYHTPQDLESSNVISRPEMDDYESSIPFTSGFVIFDKEMTHAVCSFASGTSHVKEGGNFLICDAADQSCKGAFLNTPVVEYQSLWTFERDGMICGFAYSYDYGFCLDVIRNTDDIRIGADGQAINMQDPGTDHWKPEEDECFEAEPLTDDSEACYQMLLIHRFRPNSLIAMLPKDIIVIICDCVFALDDVDNDEIQGLIADQQNEQNLI